jgi:signal recognition particle GTPase
MDNIFKDLEASFNDGAYKGTNFALENHPLFKICVTGGNQGGKTTSLAYLSEKLTTMGYKVFVVP